MLTPMDIRNKEFKKVFKGYKEDEVDEFLDKIVEDFERIYRENGELKDKLTVINEKNENYVSIEKTLQSTLIIAQTTADDVVSNARKKAEMIISEAETQAKKIIEEANTNTIKLSTEYEELKKEVHVFNTRFRTFMEAELESLSCFIKDL